MTEDRPLAVLVITDERADRASILASIRVRVETTGDDKHDALHAIMLVSGGLESGEVAFDDEPGKPNDPNWHEHDDHIAHSHRFGAMGHTHDPASGNVIPDPPESPPPAVIRCGDPYCPGNAGRGLPPRDHSCALGKGLHG